MNRNHLDPIDHAANVLPTDAYSVRMDKRAEYEKKYPIVYFHGSDAANAFVARAVVAILLCAMFFFALYEPWVEPIVPNASIFILAPVCLFLVVLAYRSIGFATSVLVIGFLGVIAATFVQDSRNEAAEREAALRQRQRADAPLGACGIYAAALARHQKEGERLRAQACLAARRAEQSRIQTSPARPDR
ncbi:hypothetical protein [Massilia sp. LjRoot122]|uniref:hypothetical protein n=1 Tax=Massilia sp. LjRoot122 TaxID=3342257 RepID=UPI003ECC678F